jgi:RNA polymerase sigma-70 factor (ECF subfamily)
MNKDGDDKGKTSPDQWVELYGDYLYNYAYSRVNDKQLAYDLIQDTFLAALSALKSFKGQSSEKTWMIAILKRKIIDHYRKNSRKREHNLLDKHFHDENENLPFYESGDNQGHWIEGKTPQNWHLSAIEAIENEELREIIYLCIDGLPARWASVFTLRIIEDLSSDEVCKELGITASNLWVIVHRAKLQLRECIEKNWL